MVVERVMVSSSLQLLANWKKSHNLVQSSLSSMQWARERKREQDVEGIMKGINGIEEAFKLYFMCNQPVVP